MMKALGSGATSDLTGVSDEALLIRRDALLVLDFLLHILHERCESNCRVTDTLICLLGKSHHETLVQALLWP